MRLALAGERVICVARPETARAIAEQGMTLVTDDGEETVRLEAVEELAEPVDLLLVTVKSYSLDDGISRIEAEPGVVLPLLNGLEHMGVLRRRFRERRGGDHRPLRGVSGVADADRPADSGRCERRRYRGSGAAGTGWHRHARRRQ